MYSLWTGGFNRLPVFILFKKKEEVMDIRSGDKWKYSTPSGTPIANTTAVTLKAAVTGKRNFLSDFQIFNNHATVSTLVTIKDGATQVWCGNVQAVNGSVVVNLSVPIEMAIGSALTAVCVTTGSSVFVNAQGYTES